MQLSVDGIMPIPRKKKDTLVTFGLVGRIHLESDWTEDDVKAEVRSAFNDATGGDNSFPFKFLQIAGTGSKSLMVPRVSASYKWTPREVAGRADRPIYILLEKDLKDEVCIVFKLHAYVALHSLYRIIVHTALHGIHRYIWLQQTTHAAL